MKKNKIIILLFLALYLCGCSKNENYEKLKDKVKVGDYINIIEKNNTYIAKHQFTGTDNDQNISLANLNDWIVIKSSSNSIELMSLNVTDDELCFNGKTGYKNYIYVLNDLSKSFNGSYVIGGRAFGYKNQTEKIENDTCIDNTSLCENKKEYNQQPVEALGFGDEEYKDDYDLSKKLNVLSAGNNKYSSNHYWVASREIHIYNISPVYFMGKYVDATRNLDITTEVLYEDSMSFGKKNNEHCHSVRPIIIISPDSSIISGDGQTKETAYNIK